MRYRPRGGGHAQAFSTFNRGGNNVGSLREVTSWVMLRRMNAVAETHVATGIGPEVFPESESFYRTALESLSEGVMILDAECRIIRQLLDR